MSAAYEAAGNMGHQQAYKAQQPRKAHGAARQQTCQQQKHKARPFHVHPKPRRSLRAQIQHINIPPQEPGA